MTILYSQSTGGFYHATLSSFIPDDATPITNARHEELIAAAASGSAIVPGGKGTPIIRRATSAQQRANLTAGTDAEASRRIALVSPIWRQLNDSRTPTPEGAVRFARIDAIRAASELIKQEITDAPAGSLGDYPITENTLWPEFDQ